MRFHLDNFHLTHYCRIEGVEKHKGREQQVPHEWNGRQSVSGVTELFSVKMMIVGEAIWDGWQMPDNCCCWTRAKGNREPGVLHLQNSNQGNPRNGIIPRVETPEAIWPLSHFIGKIISSPKFFQASDPILSSHQTKFAWQFSQCIRILSALMQKQ